MTDKSDAPLWTPSPDRVAGSAMARFAKVAGERAGRPLDGFRALHAWSIEDREAFWDLVWDFCGIVGEKGGRTLENGDAMPGARFFPEARLNFAENLLRRSGDCDAIVFKGEDKAAARLSWDELRALVSRIQQALVAAGVGEGDRVAAMLPNRPETVAFMLATASIGAIWSSCSPDFGERGVLDRFGQIEPKVFVTVDGYWYAGKRIEIAAKLKPIVDQLTSVRKTVVISYLGAADEVAAGLRDAVALDAFLDGFEAKELSFERLPFGHPLYVMFSSGTTGVPKCIVHSAGGTLIQQLKEHVLHCDVGEGDRVFYFTTCGWMMWNWLVAGLGAGATLLLYDGSPFHPTPAVLFDFADEEAMTFFGTSAKWIDGVKKQGLRPRETHSLKTVRAMASTGSPLAESSFDWVYEAVKPDMQLASISGGTDICSCFVLGNAMEPVWRGEIQGPGLGLAIATLDDDGKPLARGKGELSCVKAFPAMPIGFWNDPDGEKYRAAYFDRFPNVWVHGDFAEWTEHGGIIIHGRSDATLNPGGVRIGTAEIYAQVEKMEEIVEALCIGQEHDGDVRVVLFVRLKEGAALDDDLVKRVKLKIREGASPRHVPAKVVAVADIPRTKSGKIVELAVREVVHGRPVKNKEALANPEALDLFAGLEELKG
ncbi:acetoacetate--CoA ligase [Hansschlegelia zhihuaiae]|uniref:Acetoacetate--CoA ligase n=1 Tax=Hansschlegelia zhihuaiae TaxID=405005 RepID=A0A4Q0MIN1_9HYPH|nr:acetoacetate--CoA ligase [Hansschlegelia zhihuaiae]RXF73378.1 acetoacetate--CoA ligase [Hansschlegelia zhihuaiae]